MKKRKTSLIDKKGRERKNTLQLNDQSSASANTKWNCVKFWAENVVDLTRTHIQKGKRQKAKFRQSKTLEKRVQQ